MFWLGILSSAKLLLSRSVAGRASDGPKVPSDCSELSGLVEEKCTETDYGGGALVGCQCVFLRPLESCPAADGAKAMGFQRLSASRASASPATGGRAPILCMYWVALGDAQATDPAVVKANMAAELSRTKRLVQEVGEMAGKNARANSAGMWALTLPPSPVDKYGTPTCGGWCTTPNVTHWNQFTTTPTPSTLTLTTTTRALSSRNQS